MPSNLQTQINKIQQSLKSNFDLTVAILNHTDAIILPDGYTRIEYIQSTGNQYIDTNYLPKSLSTKYEIGFMRTSTNGSYNPIINSEEDLRFGVLCSDTVTSRGICWAGSRSSYKVTTFPIVNNEKYDIIFDKTGISVNNTKYNFNGTVTEATASWTTMINHRKTSSTGYASEYSLGRWYYLRIYEDEKLVRNFIPVKNSNNVACLYDAINKTTHLNVGSGSFTAGPEV